MDDMHGLQDALDTPTVGVEEDDGEEDEGQERDLVG